MSRLRVFAEDQPADHVKHGHRHKPVSAAD